MEKQRLTEAYNLTIKEYGSYRLKMIQFEGIADTFAEFRKVVYSDDYNCVQFSRDMSTILTEKGYRVSPKIGYVKRTDTKWGPHLWLSIDIEPTNGGFATGEYRETHIFEPQEKEWFNQKFQLTNGKLHYE